MSRKSSTSGSVPGAILMRATFGFRVSEKTGVPVAYTSGKKELLDQFLAEGHDPKYIGQPLPIDIYMKRDWDSWISTLAEKRPQQLEYL